MEHAFGIGAVLFIWGGATIGSMMLGIFLYPVTEGKNTHEVE